MVERSGDFALAVSVQLKPRIHTDLLWVGNNACDASVSELGRLAKQRGVDFEIKIMVKDAELISLLSRATAVLCISRLEPFGLAPLEANACGTTVVAIAEGGVRESIMHGENGLLVPNANPQSIAATIRTILEDPSQAAQLRGKCRAVVFIPLGNGGFEKRLRRSKVEPEQVKRVCQLSNVEM